MDIIMNNYLTLLAKQILEIIPDGLSKVKFAKVLYFAHKGLVQKDLVNVEEMKFIRMPLGPVPVGFRELSQNKDIEVVEVPTNPLVYDKQVYTLRNELRYLDGERRLNILQIANQLVKLTTSELVAAAHREPSWVNHKNGDEYFIEEKDLEIALPSRKNQSGNIELEDQHLQAKLVKGMLEEIVEESTSLEYPKSN